MYKNNDSEMNVRVFTNKSKLIQNAIHLQYIEKPVNDFPSSAHSENYCLK